MKAFGIVSIAGAALAVLMAVASCSSSNSSSPTPSGAGESCTRTSDCQSGLVCLGDTCVAKGGGVTVDAGMTDVDAGEGGTVVVSARLGTSCASTAECGDPTLVCVPTPLGGAKGGLCDLASFGITPSQKVCGECATAADCCELPFNFSEVSTIEVANDAGQFFVVRTCSDLLTFAIGGNTAVCGTATDPTLITACNYYTHYCNGCVVDSWDCNAGRCAYTGPCTVGTLSSPAVWNSCPTLTRSARQLALTCAGGDAGTLGTCQQGACQTSPDCVGLIPSDLNGTSSACQTGDCVCFQNACYFQCASDLDCPGGYACDTTNKVCAFTGCAPGASADATCKVQLQDTRATCKQVNGAGNCVIPCTGDHDCSQFSGAIPGTVFTPSVCGPDGYCVSVVGGCTSDSDCRTQNTATNGFCVAPSAPAQVHSAIANH
jgi:hypothetical protein